MQPLIALNIIQTGLNRGIDGLEEHYLFYYDMLQVVSLVLPELKYSLQE